MEFTSFSAHHDGDGFAARRFFCLSRSIFSPFADYFGMAASFGRARDDDVIALIIFARYFAYRPLEELALFCHSRSAEAQEAQAASVFPPVGARHGPYRHRRRSG